jgi:sialidase-1
MNASKTEPTDIQTVDKQVTILAPATDEFPRNMGGDIIRLRDGRLFLAYSQWLSGGTDDDSSRVVGKLSLDDGKTWGDFFPVIEPDESRAIVRMPSLILLSDGRLALFARCHQTIGIKWVVMTVCKDESQDLLYGNVWTEPKCITPSGPGGHIIIAQRVIRTRKGRIIVPIASPWPWDQKDNKTDDIRSCCMLSDDDGETWCRSQSVLAGPGRGLMEPCVLELNGGRLMMLLRTQVHRQYISYSDDGGDTWTPATEVPHLISPESPAALSQVPDTKLIMVVWNNNNNSGRHSENRAPLTVGFSDNGGITWSGFHNLEDESGKTWSYPSIIFLDGKAHVLYYERPGIRTEDKRISLKMSRFSITPQKRSVSQ